MTRLHDALARDHLEACVEHVSAAHQELDRAVGALAGPEHGAARQCRSELASIRRRLDNLLTIVKAETTVAEAKS